MKEYPFNTAYTQARELYGLELAPDTFETLGMIAWDKIGNKRCRLYKFQEKPQRELNGDWYIDLPCNADILEAVTTDYEDYQEIGSGSVVNRAATEHYIESRKFDTSFGYVSGKYIKYHKEGNRLYLANNYPIVNILYKGVIVDEEGLPSLNDKELDAVAVFCAYSDMYKKALVTKNTTTMQFAQLLEQQWKTKCTQARVPTHISQNEMDEILNVSTSWDRKRFGKSFKPTR